VRPLRRRQIQPVTSRTDGGLTTVLKVRVGAVLLDEGSDDAVAAGEALRGDLAALARGLNILW
jgi:hypothetical protein